MRSGLRCEWLHRKLLKHTLVGKYLSNNLLALTITWKFYILKWVSVHTQVEFRFSFVPSFYIHIKSWIQLSRSHSNPKSHLIAEEPFAYVLLQIFIIILNTHK